MRHYPADVVPPEDLLKRIDNNIEVNRWLEEDTDSDVCIKDMAPAPLRPRRLRQFAECNLRAYRKRVCSC